MSVSRENARLAESRFAPWDRIGAKVDLGGKRLKVKDKTSRIGTRMLAAKDDVARR